MGCVESSDALSSDATDESPEPAEKPSSPQRQRPGKSKSKARLKRKKRPTSRQKRADSMYPKEQHTKEPTETKIHVIWRRVSLFSSRRDSVKSNKSMDMEVAGPSCNSPKTLQIDFDARAQGGDPTKRAKTSTD